TWPVGDGCPTLDVHHAPSPELREPDRLRTDRWNMAAASRRGDALMGKRKKLQPEDQQEIRIKPLIYEPAPPPTLVAEAAFVRLNAAGALQVKGLTASERLVGMLERHTLLDPAAVAEFAEQLRPQNLALCVFLTDYGYPDKPEQFSSFY